MKFSEERSCSEKRGASGEVSRTAQGGCRERLSGNGFSKGERETGKQLFRPACLNHTAERGETQI